jgi:hypothetical protein
MIANRQEVPVFSPLVFTFGVQGSDAAPTPPVPASILTGFIFVDAEQPSHSSSNLHSASPSSSHSMTAMNSVFV